MKSERKSTISGEIFDHYPDSLQCDDMPLSFVFPAQEGIELHYCVTPVIRGDALFSVVELRINSPWLLWQKKLKVFIEQKLRIYPNFAALSNLATLEHDQQVSQLGVRVRPRRGEGLNFHQMREYRQGDNLARIDWKATSRMQKLISREYQDERDQDVIFLLDCGRRLCSQEGGYSHFDHCLNAILLSAYVALKKGDGIGLMTFSGQQRWYPPEKGVVTINRLLNRVYDLASTTSSTDFIAAAEQLLIRHRKRALVILISNIKEEDNDDLQAAVELLKRRHLVMVASLHEHYLEKDCEIVDFDSALEYAGIKDFNERRKKALNKLKQQNTYIIDTLPEYLHVRLVNQYLALKKAGVM